mmetsp:Transcript_21782/g.64218  ORF Transcript_21782/g.64218 Transcript_21782/m.64218 type:complete len:81 (+) Transcript_21782:572-814(+)
MIGAGMRKKCAIRAWSVFLDQINPVAGKGGKVQIPHNPLVVKFHLNSEMQWTSDGRRLIQNLRQISSLLCDTLEPFPSLA